MEIFGLPEHTLKTMREIFARHPQVEKVVVYGSRAMGNYKTGSDIDLSMYGKYTDSITYQDLLHISGELDDSDIPYLVDLSVFDDLNHVNLREHIERVGKVFYEKEVLSWETVKLGAVCNIAIGKTPSRKNPIYWDANKDGDNVWLSIADLSRMTSKFIENSKEYISEQGAKLCKPVKKGTLVMSFKLSIGKLAFVERTLYTNEAIAAFNIKNERQISSDFLYYYLSFYDWDKETRNDTKLLGKTLNKKKLLQIPIFIPSLPVQKQIVEKLDAAFADIDKAISATQKNIENADALFQKYLNDAFHQSAKGSETSFLSDISENLDSKRKPITKNKRIAGEIPYYGASGKVDSVEGFIFDEDLLLVSEDGANLLARTYPIAFSISDKSWVNNHAHVLKFENITTQLFVEFYLNSISIEKWVSGMAQPKLNQKKLNEIPIPIPSLPEQERILNSIRLLSQEKIKFMSSYNQKIDLLVNLKSSILNQAFSGELTKDAA